MVLTRESRRHIYYLDDAPPLDELVARFAPAIASCALDPNEDALFPEDDIRFLRGERSAATLVLNGLPLLTSGNVRFERVVVPCSFGKTSAGFAAARLVFALHVSCTAAAAGVEEPRFPGQL